MTAADLPPDLPARGASWIDTEQPDVVAALEFHGALFGWRFADATPPGGPGWAARCWAPPSRPGRAGCGCGTYPQGATLTLSQPTPPG